MSSGNIILLVVLVGLLILYPVLMMRRNKREQEKQKQLVDSLKPGEYVLTYSGVFGKITEVIEKEIGKFIVVETGEKNKNYITVSENAIYSVVNNNPKVYDVDGNPTSEVSAKDEPVKENLDKQSEGKDTTSTKEKIVEKAGEDVATDEETEEVTSDKSESKSKKGKK